MRSTSVFSIALVAAFSFGLSSLPAEAKALAKAAKPDPLPAEVIKQWPALAGQIAYGRLIKKEPRPTYAKMSPCFISVELCKATEPLLEVGTVLVAEKNGVQLKWLIFLPMAHKAKVGDFLTFDFPDKPNEIGQARYDNNDKLGKPPCGWGDVASAPGVTGALCGGWDFTQLKFKW